MMHIITAVDWERRVKDLKEVLSSFFFFIKKTTFRNKLIFLASLFFVLAELILDFSQLDGLGGTWW